ncbi:MAG: hypothetical protein IJH39_06315 [Clostridia bacterium]|nr:hypothetical protein [Clostridia bacterium]
MVGKSKLKNPKRISLNIEEEQYYKLKQNVNSVSAFFRQCMDNYLNTNNNLTDLKIELNRKINERNNLNVDIEILENQIKELETTLKENENNNNMLLELMEIVKKVCESEFNNNGITKDRVTAIANNKINPSILIKECEKQGIKIIKNSQITNSKIRPEINNIDNRLNNKNPLNTIIKSFFREWKSQHTKKKYKTKKRFIEAPQIENKFKLMCNTKEISFKEFKDYVLTHED